MRIKSLAVRFILFFSGVSALIIVAVIALNYRFSEKIIMDGIKENAQNVALRTANKIEITLVSIEKIAKNTGFALQEGDLDRSRIAELLRAIVGNNPEIYGAGVAFEPYAFDKNQEYFAPYYYREGNELKFVYMGDEAYRYFDLDWYQIPRELNRAVWSEPYFDDVMMSSYSLPFYGKTPEGLELKGVITVDIAIDHLTDIVSSVKVLKTGDAYLFSRYGMVITHPVKDFVMNDTIFSIAAARNDAHLRGVGRDMLKGNSGFVPFLSIARNKPCWMYYTPVPSTGWTLAVIFPEDELFADIRRDTVISSALAGGGVLLLLVIIVILTHSITKPLRRMAGAVVAMGGGNLDAALPRAGSDDEVGRLTEAFGRMQSSLKEYIKKLTETTAAKERIESELHIAREIQGSILPRIFPAFPHRGEFDIYAVMEPAKEVGGDFYDFVLIGERRLYFVMGDVSGKGVPAALFMMIAKTLLKNEAMQGASAAEILTKANNIIAMDDATSMFATVFCGILDIATGVVEFANAGHNPPMIGRAGGAFEFLEVSKGFVLGPMPDFEYKQGSVKLETGDTFFLYTDGVTEAMDPGQKQYSEARLKDTLERVKAFDVQSIVSAVREDVRDFTREAPQSDDITMLAVRYNGVATT